MEFLTYLFIVFTVKLTYYTEAKNDKLIETKLFFPNRQEINVQLDLKKKYSDSIMKKQLQVPETNERRFMKSYTVFQPIHRKMHVNIPESPNFPVQEFYNPKNVWKSSIGTQRKKRSPAGNVVRMERRPQIVASEFIEIGRMGNFRTETTTQKTKQEPKRKCRTSKCNKKKGYRGKRDLNEQNLGGRRLILANDAQIEDFPYVVSIQKDGEHWCAGALLNHRIVVTTANCVWKSVRVSHMTVRAGSRYTNYGGQTARIRLVLKHPNWSITKIPQNDLAMLLLDRELEFSDSCHAVDIPNEMMVPAFNDAFVTSWGSETQDGKFFSDDNALHSYRAQLMNHSKCNAMAKRYGVEVKSDFMCLSQLGKKAPCTRDTGAPAVSDGVVWGLASWGIRKMCGSQNYPAMFSFLAHPENLRFIVNATNFMMSDMRSPNFLDRPDKNIAMIDRLHLMPT